MENTAEEEIIFYHFLSGPSEETGVGSKKLMDGKVSGYF